jgi:hypothetical protein
MQNRVRAVTCDDILQSLDVCYRQTMQGTWYDPSAILPDFIIVVARLVSMHQEMRLKPGMVDVSQDVHQPRFGTATIHVADGV